MNALPIAISLVGGLGIGSALTQYLTSGRDRREARSNVLRHLEAVEKTRWATKAPVEEFTDALRDLEAAALVAQIPSDLFHLYKLVAKTARDISGIDLSIDPAGELPGDIPPELAYLVSDIAADLSRSIWKPLSNRITRRGRVKNYEQLFFDIRDARVIAMREENQLQMNYRVMKPQLRGLPRPQ